MTHVRRQILIVVVSLLSCACSGQPATTTVLPERATTPSSTTTSVLRSGDMEVSKDISLRGDGLGVATFGDAYEDAADALVQALGPPTKTLDTPGELASGASSFFYGGPDASEVVLTWHPLGLEVAFSTYPFFRDDGELHFSGWAIFEPEVPEYLTTDEALEVGATFSEVSELYGSRFVFEDGVCGKVAWIEPAHPDGLEQRISLFFDYSVADESDAALLGLHAGAGPGC